MQSTFIHPGIKSVRPIYVWLYSGIFLVFSMIAVGGLTRLTESGLSITEWNVIMGSIPPLNESDWQEEFQKYQSSPEYIHKNFDFTIEDFKYIYWWEWIHRQLGRFIGLVFLFPFIYFISKNSFGKKGFRRLLFIFFMGGLQGFFGWYMVKSGLINEPRVSHYRLALHLSTALITISLIWWLILDIKRERSKSYPPSDTPSWHQYLAFFTLIVLSVQIIYGAFVAGLDAGQIHNTWPKMDGAWFHQGLFYKGLPDALHTAESITTIQFIHRTMAVVVVLMIGTLWFSARRYNYLHPHQWKGLHTMMAMVVIQFMLGVFTLLYQVPILLGLLHQLGAVILLFAMLHHLHSISAKSKLI